MGISIWDQDRKTLSPLAFDKSGDISLNITPLWTIEGDRIVYLSFREASYILNWKSSTGTGIEEPLISNMLASIGIAVPSSWSEDGKTMILTQGHIGDGRDDSDIIALSMEGDRTWEPLLNEEYSEFQPRISDDGQWMAYTSNESGRDEVYVRPFPDVNKWRKPVSVNGGDNPLWSPDGRKLFYLNDGAVIAVTLETEPEFRLGKPVTLFHGNYVGSNPSFYRDFHVWDIHPDGKRFLMLKPLESEDQVYETASPRKINIVLNWFEELKKLAPVQ